jgi:hypothetical protein
VIEFKLALPAEVLADPQETLTGICCSCGTRVDVSRLETESREFQGWPATECRHCHAVVYVRPQSKSDATVAKEAIEENKRLREELEKAKASAPVEGGSPFARDQTELINGLGRENAALRNRIRELEWLLTPPLERALARMEKALKEEADAAFTGDELEALEKAETVRLPKLTAENLLEEED